MADFAPQDTTKKIKKNIFFSLTSNTLRIRKLTAYEYRCVSLKFCQNEGMTIKKDRIALIRNAVANATTKVDPKFADLLADLQAEKLAEDFTLEHGTQHASKEDIEQEFVSLDAVESDKDDIDENDEEQTDMDCVSGSFRDLFDTIKS